MLHLRISAVLIYNNGYFVQKHVSKIDIYHLFALKLRVNSFSYAVFRDADR